MAFGQLLLLLAPALLLKLHLLLLLLLDAFELQFGESRFWSQVSQKTLDQRDHLEEGIEEVHSEEVEGEDDGEVGQEWGMGVLPECNLDLMQGREEKQGVLFPGSLGVDDEEESEEIESEEDLKLWQGFGYLVVHFEEEDGLDGYGKLCRGPVVARLHKYHRVLLQGVGVSVPGVKTHNCFY